MSIKDNVLIKAISHTCTQETLFDWMTRDVCEDTVHFVVS